MNTLKIDTSVSKELTVGLFTNKKKEFLKRKIDSKKSQALLTLIEKILKKNRVEISEIDAIEIDLGPGSFTGLRVGVAISNTLSFVFNISLNRKSPGELVQPQYK